MKTTIAEAKAINDYIAAMNAEFETTRWCKCVLTADDLAEHGVHTLEDFKRWQVMNLAPASRW
jgi:hypothetical protein